MTITRSCLSNRRIHHVFRALLFLFLIAAGTTLLSGCHGPDDAASTTDISRLVERISAAQSILEKGLHWQIPEDLLTAPAAVNCATYQVLGVTVVLTAREDGSNALWQRQGLAIVPAQPYLRDSMIHPAGRDFVKDSLDIANHLFIASGACFLFESEPRYVTEKNDILSELSCDDRPENLAYVRHFLERKASEDIPDNPYKDRVIILYPWGKGSEPAGTGCSSVDARYVKMASDFHWVFHADGRLVLGNNHLAHELGHFMGLGHPFPSFATDIKQDVEIDNPTALPLTPEYLPGVAETHLQAVAELARNAVLEWPYTFDQDNARREVKDQCCEILTRLPAVDDTPADLGMGFPLSQGHEACSDDRVYHLEHYRCFVEDPPDSQTYVPDPAHPAKETLSFEINDRVRNNLMSYWQCGPFDQRFSAEQRDRMHSALANLESRRNLVIKTIQRPVVSGGRDRFATEIGEHLKPFPRYHAEKLRERLRDRKAPDDLGPWYPKSALKVAIERGARYEAEGFAPAPAAGPQDPCKD